MQLRFLRNDFISQSATAKPRAKEHLVHGAGRRLGTLASAIEQIFENFPPGTRRPIGQVAVDHATLALHAFLANLAGFFDNCAWAIVFEREIDELIQRPLGVGLFKPSFRKWLSEPLVKYLTSIDQEGWRERYLKDYRDALVHRIPPYIPPSTLTEQDGVRYNALERAKLDHLTRGDLESLAAAEAAQRDLEQPCFVFTHSYEEGEPRLIQIHPQVLTDALTILEFSGVFLSAWRSPPEATAI